ncbi:uncharacterized protein LOC126837854 [Adelges cooleyi]|uniref:uncharacterized protein LOC126837854 n=1 Tax=Adelges cooleyi TaxID=133065 RepID=UPI00218090EC|nr:uncharacterized protein LOC126837854 [Adelges cooleyi]
MKLQLSFMSIILVLVFFLTTEIDGKPSKAHIKLSKTVVIRPTASEITNAISHTNISQEIQVENLQKFFVIGTYSNKFIELLSTYDTLSSNPIVFSSDEIGTLTSDYRKQPRNNRIITQFKLYRKIQEIQCTIYVTLTGVLPFFKDFLAIIADHVHMMIQMLYLGKLAASGWLWELHIKLLGLEHLKLQEEVFREKHLPGINETLNGLITSCQANNYLPLDVIWSTIMAMNSDLYTNMSRLPIDDGYLLLETLQMFPETIFAPIPGFVVDWGNTPDAFKNEMENIMHQYNFGEWTKEPYAYIEFQKQFLDVVRVQLYGHIWVHLVIYKNKGRECRPEHDSFISALNGVIYFAYVDDETFNNVLNLLSELYEPDDEQINQITSIIENEINRILCIVTGSNNAHAAIDCELIEENCAKKTPTINLETNARCLQQFASNINTGINELPVNVLLFYINGNETTE